MIDGEKIFKALKLGKVTGLGCTLTSAETELYRYGKGWKNEAAIQ